MVTKKKILAILFSWGLVTVLLAGVSCGQSNSPTNIIAKIHYNYKLSWDAPTHNEEFCLEGIGHNPDQVSCEASGGVWTQGSLIQGNQLPLTFNIYHGNSSGNYNLPVIFGIMETFYTYTAMSGQECFVITAVNALGNESIYSNEECQK